MAERTGKADGWSVSGPRLGGWWHWTAYGPLGSRRGSAASRAGAEEQAKAAAAELREEADRG